MYSIAVQRLRHVRLQEAGLGLDVIGVDNWLRAQVQPAGLVTASIDLIAGRLNSTRPRVRRALQALADAPAGVDGRLLLVWDESLCVGYFPGHHTDYPPGSTQNANSRLQWVQGNYRLDCAPVEACVAELTQWVVANPGQTKAAKQTPQQQGVLDLSQYRGQQRRAGE